MNFISGISSGQMCAISAFVTERNNVNITHVILSADYGGSADYN